MLLLIRQAVKDPDEQRRVYELVVNQLREELKRKVEEATKTLTQEKKAVLGEQARTETVFARAGEGVVVVDGHGRVMLMNPAAEEICGARLADAAGKPVTERAGESRVVALASELEVPPDPAAPGDAAVAGDASAQRSIRASWAVVKNEAGRIVGMVMTLTDLAKHRELDRLEKEFVAHMTHELRSPLNAIMASLDILEEEIGPKLDPEQKKVFSSSQLNSRRLEAIVNDVLDYSKLEAGQMSVFPAKVAPEALVEEAARSLKPWADRKGINFGAALPPGLPPVSAEHRRIVQVLVNLASNAIKFTPKGGTVSLRAAPSRVDPSGMVDFAVLDNGCGIPDADKGKIFQRFMQVGPTANYGAGTGLGLVIAKSLVELHGGTLWFESQAGRGTAFYFSLPVWRPPVEAAPSKKTPPPAPRPWWKRLLGLD